MADQKHVELLRQGELAWNQWREENRNVTPDLRQAELQGSQLAYCNLSGSDLREARLAWADLRSTNLKAADLRRVMINDARAPYADFSNSQLQESYLWGSDFREAVFRKADLSGANLMCAQLVRADFSGANITGCKVYGTSAWEVNLEGTKQEELVITPPDNLGITSFNEPGITVDNLEVAQFIYLLLQNEKIRDVIDTITSKVVLILGRFTPERKAVLDALREELRKHDYLPVLFDFPETESRDLTETVSLLARMARFIIADLTSPSSIPKELEAIVPSLAVPVQPLIEGSTRPFAMFKDYWKYDWVLPVYRYDGLETLLAVLAEKVVRPAEVKLKTLEERRRAIEVELMKDTSSPFP